MPQVMRSYKGKRWNLAFIMCAQLNGFDSGQPSLAEASLVLKIFSMIITLTYTYQKGKKSMNPTKHISFKQRTVAFMEPFTLDIFILKCIVSASVTHRITCNQVAVSGTNSNDMKDVLKPRSEIPVCLAIGRNLADRAREVDVYTASYTPRESDKFDGKIRAVQPLIDNGIDIKFYLD
ncbi:uncharacterized protein [Primulina eburnea]|uniref:uncharacterized protein n=1 Tax=Primulina eburnea TaxID=1245227 RepID=UPI003C6C30DB